MSHYTTVRARNYPRRWPRSAMELGEYITVTDAADELGISRDTVWGWIAAEELWPIKLGMRQLHVKRRDLNALLRAKGIAAPIEHAATPTGGQR